jgi:hypothetical protein
MIHHPPTLFGQQTSAKKFIANPPFAQCNRCHYLGHIIERCRQDPKLIVCFKCGGSHSNASHRFNCPIAKYKHKGKKCNCDLYCFLCKEKKNRKHNGHDAHSIHCPLQSSYHAPIPMIKIPPLSAPVANINPISSTSFPPPVEKRIQMF